MVGMVNVGIDEFGSDSVTGYPEACAHVKVSPLPLGSLDPEPLSVITEPGETLYWSGPALATGSLSSVLLPGPQPANMSASAIEQKIVNRLRCLINTSCRAGLTGAAAVFEILFLNYSVLISISQALLI